MIQFKMSAAIVMSMVFLTGCAVTSAKGDALLFDSFYKSLEHKMAICKKTQASLGNHLEDFVMNNGFFGKPNRLNHSYNMDGFLIEILNFEFEYTGPGIQMDGDKSVGCLFEKGTDRLIRAWYDYGPLKKGEIVLKTTPLTDPDPKEIQRQWESIVEKGVNSYTYVLDSELNLKRSNHEDTPRDS